jgi:manganese transport protein
MNSLKKYYYKSREPFSWKIFSKFLGGAGIMVSTGYVDPGNFSSNLAASQFKYSLLFVILFANIMAMIFQFLCVKLGVVTKLDLSESCKKYFNRYVNFGLYILCEIAIVCTDLAEVIGSAIALKLLFGLPVVYGVILTGIDVLFILLFFKAKFLKYFEMGIILLVMGIATCFLILVFKTTSDWNGVFSGFLPNVTVLGNNKVLYIVLGLIGSTLMPHNLYLHSNLVKYRSSRQGKLGDINVDDKDVTKYKNRFIHSILRYFYLDSSLSLAFAFIVNSCILISAASSNIQTYNLTEAFNLFTSNLGKWSGILFAVALLLSGQSSTITGTITGQIIMNGFLGENFKVLPWIRRLITRSLAIIPAVIIASTSGEAGLSKLLVLSQVILSLQLPFAIFPLIYFTSNRNIMTIDCVKYTKDTDSTNSIDDDTLNDEVEESIDFSNSIFTKIIVVLMGTLITGLNIYLLSNIKSSFTD